MTTTWSETDLLRELNPVVEGELNRHLKVAKEWFPHEYIPWSDGRNYDGLMGGDAWTPEDSPISDVARSALVVNLLTEDNLPSYHHEIATIFGRDDAWGAWVHRWTAEEGRHGIAMRDYLLVKRSVDPAELERFRMTHMSQGYAADHGDTMMHNLAYVSFQELATRVSHRNTGRYTDDPMAERLLARIAADENLHMVFYRNLMGCGARAGRPTRPCRPSYDDRLRVPHARLRHPRLRAQGGGDGRRRHLRPALTPRRGGHARAAVLEGVRARGPLQGGRAGAVSELATFLDTSRQAGGPVRGQARHPEGADEHRLNRRATRA